MATSPQSPKSGSNPNRPGNSRGGPGGGQNRGGPNDRRGGPGGGRGRGGNDRGGRGGGRREPSEFSEATLSLDRVTRVVKGGRRMRFRAVVVVGNKKGKVGLGTGKANEVVIAIKKAASAAKRAMIRVPLNKGTLPHQVELKFKAARILLMPAKPGTGIIAGGALRVIMDQLGVKDVLSKRFGSRNKLVNAQATMKALAKLRGTFVEDKPAAKMPDGEDELEADKSAVQIKEVSKKEVSDQRDIHRKNAISE